MAFSETTVQRLLFAAIMLLHYASFAATYRQGDISSELLNNPHSESPTFLHHAQSHTVPIKTENWTSGGYPSYKGAVIAGDAKWRSAETDNDSTVPTNSRDSGITGPVEDCPEAGCTLQRSTSVLDSHNLSFDGRRSMAPAMKNRMAKGQMHTFDIRLMPGASTSALVDATRAPQWRAEGVTNISGQADSADMTMPKAAYEVSSMDTQTFREDMYKFASSLYRISEPRTGDRRIDDTGLTQPSIHNWAALKPAQVVKFLLHPPEIDLQEESLAPPEEGSAIHTVRDEPLSEQTDERQNEPRRPTEETSLLRQGARGRHPYAPEVNEDCSQSSPYMCRSLKRSSSSLHSGRPSPQNSPPEQSVPQQPSCTHQDREFDQEQQSNRDVSGVLWRRLGVAERGRETPYATTTLDRLRDAQDDLASIFAKGPTRHTDMNETPDVRRNQRSENETRAKPEATAERKRGLRGSRNKRFRSESGRKGEAESLSQSYQRYLKEEAHAVGYKPGFWQNVPLKNVLLVGGLLLLGQPLFALHAMGITLAYQLMQLDASLEQQTAMHLRARRRLVQQYLKEAQKESEELGASAPTDAPSESDKRRPQLNPMAYNFFDTNVLQLVDPSAVVVD